MFQSLLYNYSVVFVVIAMDGMNHDMDPGKSLSSESAIRIGVPLLYS